jgi:hypothetical protein
MSVKQVILLCVVFSFLGYGFSYIFPHNQTVKSAHLIEQPYISPLPLQADVETNIISEVEPNTTSIAKITKPKPLLKKPMASMYIPNNIKPGIYNKGDQDYDNYLLPFFKLNNNEKFQVLESNLMGDATYDTNQNEFPTIKVYEPDYNDDSIYQNHKEKALAYFESPKFEKLFGGYDVEFSYEVMDVFSDGFSDKIVDIFEVNCRKNFCVLLAKLSGPLDRDAHLELREEIIIKVDEIANMKGFGLYNNDASGGITSMFSTKHSDYNLELRMQIRFAPLPISD